MPNSIQDRVFLDDVFDLIAEDMAQGLAPRIGEHVRERPHLENEIRELARLASDVAWSPPRPPSFEGYEIIGEVGRGGMGLVYLAKQESLGGRQVALKVLPPEISSSPRLRMRFENEIRALASIRHRGVVAIHDVVRSEETIAYALEWVDGSNLAQMIKALEAVHEAGRMQALREHLPELEIAGNDAGSYTVFICRLFVELARSLSAVHAAGLLHRDVKPSNILLRRDGTPLLSDFGLVRGANSGALSTCNGEFIGTPAYASPEQLRGEQERVNERSDVYSLGLTLCHAMTLNLPERGSSAADVLRHMDERRQLTLVHATPRLPKDLETVIGKAIALDPKERYATADELGDELERVLDLRPIKAQRPGPLRRAVKFVRRHRAGVTGTLLGILFTVSAFGGALRARTRLEESQQARIRHAQLELLRPLDDHQLFPLRGNRDPGARRTVPWPSREQVRARGDEVLANYDAALELSWLGSRERLRHERHVVAAAMSLRGGTGAVLDASTAEQLPVTAALVAIIASGGAPRAREVSWDAMSNDDLRLSGLLGFLMDRAALSHAAWNVYEARVNSDPFIDACLGVLHLRNDRAGSALHRLRRAIVGLGDDPFLMIECAEAALLCGEPNLALGALNRAQFQKLDDPGAAMLQLRAEIAADLGDDSSAIGYFTDACELAGSPAPFLRFANFWSKRSRLGRQVGCLQELVEHFDDPVHRALLADVHLMLASLPEDVRPTPVPATYSHAPGRTDAPRTEFQEFVNAKPHFLPAPVERAPQGYAQSTPNPRPFTPSRLVSAAAPLDSFPTLTPKTDE